MQTPKLCFVWALNWQKLLIMSVNIKEIRKMENIKNTVLSGLVISPTTCVMEFLDKTREIISIDSRLMMCKDVYELANFIINNKKLDEHYATERKQND